MKTSKNLQIILLALAPIIANAGVAEFQIFNTGVDNSGNTLQHGASDQNYEIISGPVTTIAPVVFTSEEGFPVGPWAEDNSTSAWITPSSIVNQTPGDYIYKTTFDLTGFDSNTAFLSGAWTSDNEGLGILLNGDPSADPFRFPNTGNFTVLDSQFEFTSGFVEGINTLYFKLSNFPFETSPFENPTGLRVEFDIHTAELLAEANPVPLPAAFWLFISGLSGLLWQRKSILM